MGNPYVFKRGAVLYCSSMLNLEAPQSWRDASKAERDKFSNGCGPQSAFFSAIPKGTRNFLFGLDIGCACDLHDWMYFHGVTPDDKADADSAFLRNMNKIIRHRGGFLMNLRLAVAWLFFKAVVRWGGKFFGDSNAAD